MRNQGPTAVSSSATNPLSRKCRADSTKAPRCSRRAAVSPAATASNATKLWRLPRQRRDQARPRQSLRVNYDYCKGCGMCAAECPCGAIKMEAEEI
ncbi:MAG: 4Fe-4S binding protein [Sulfuritalea sp.]|nr:4Fe-4S binding protein [Sulfuritalea sp.]